MTCQRLITALLRHGSCQLAELWNCNQSEVSRRLNDQRGILISDLCAAMDKLGIGVVMPDEDLVLVPRDELESLNLLAKRYLERRGGSE